MAAGRGHQSTDDGFDGLGEIPGARLIFCASPDSDG